MRKFNFSMPTKIVFGQDVVKDAGESLALGKKALIVTGKTSARLSGALDDVLSVLPGEYVIFDEVENNPTGRTAPKGRGWPGKKAATTSSPLAAGHL